jgi:hypothetical protein
MANFNIGSQNAATIQNIGGDAVIEGGLHASATWETVELRRALAGVEDGIAELGLTPPALAKVNEALDAAAREAAQPRPDKHRVAEHVGAVARTLKEVGALAGAGTEVVAALRRAAALLGPVGLAAIGVV